MKSQSWFLMFISYPVWYQKSSSSSSVSIFYFCPLTSPVQYQYSSSSSSYFSPEVFIIFSAADGCLSTLLGVCWRVLFQGYAPLPKVSYESFTKMCWFLCSSVRFLFYRRAFSWGVKSSLSFKSFVVDCLLDIMPMAEFYWFLLLTMIVSWGSTGVSWRYYC